MPWEQGGVRRLVQGPGREIVMAGALVVALESRGRIDGWVGGWMDGWKIYLQETEWTE